MESVLAGFLRFERRRLERSTDCSGWITVQPLAVHGTMLEAEEFQDNLRLWYGIIPANLPSRCNGYGKHFGVAHAMLCKRGGQVLARHNALKHKWQTLCNHALGQSNVFDKPTLKTGQGTGRSGARQGLARGRCSAWVLEDMILCHL